MLSVNSLVLEDFRFFYFLFTATLGAVFGLSTCLSAQVREEPEDPLNYFIGGCAAGAVLGVRGNWTMPAWKRALAGFKNFSVGEKY